MQRQRTNTCKDKKTKQKRSQVSPTQSSSPSEDLRQPPSRNTPPLVDIKIPTNTGCLRLPWIISAYQSENPSPVTHITVPLMSLIYSFLPIDCGPATMVHHRWFDIYILSSVVWAHIDRYVSCIYGSTSLVWTCIIRHLQFRQF